MQSEDHSANEGLVTLIKVQEKCQTKHENIYIKS
jgi:hypothetical protein